MNVVNKDGMHNPVVLSPGSVTFEIRDADRVTSLTALIKRMQSGDKLPRRLRHKIDVCPECKGEKVTHEIPIRRGHMFVLLVVAVVVSLLVIAVWIAILANGNTP